MAARDELAERLAELSARVEHLEIENAALRVDAPPSAAAEPRRFDRRNLLRLGGAAAAVSAGAVMLRPDAAGAVGNPVNMAVNNNAGSASTGIASSNATATLNITNSSTGHDTSGVAIEARNTDATNQSRVIHAINDGRSDAIVGEVTSANGGSGVVGIGLDAGGVVGVTLNSAFGVLGLIGNLSTGVGVLAWSGPNPKVTGTALEAKQEGKGHGVYSHIENAVSNHRAVYGSTKGTGAGVLGQVINALSKAPALQGATTGLGAGVDGSSAKGMGGRFTGKTAQIQLVPSAAASHPTIGYGGQLFVDHSNRLWFCKGGTVWKLLA